MSRSYWLLILALGGSLIASCAIGQDRTEDGKPVSNQAEQAPDTNPDTIKSSFDRVFWSKHSGDADTYRAICEKPQDREYADLCQQWRTAEATEEQARWALPQFGANVVTVLGLIATIIITGVGTRAAIRAAEAAEKNITASREVAQLQLRAYVEPSIDLPVVNPSMGTAPFNYPVRVTFFNKGVTPARNISYFCTVAISPGGFPDAELISSRASLFPNVADPRFGLDRSITISPGQHRDILSKTSQVYVWGIMRYLDVFDKEQETPFYYKIAGNDLTLGKAIYTVGPKSPT